MESCRVWTKSCNCQTGQILATYEGKILPFPHFTALRLLRISPSFKPQGGVYRALLELAKDYLKADIDLISKCIARFGLDTLLGDKYESSATPAYKISLVKDLMFLLEHLLLEYLSQNWDCIEDVFRANNEICAATEPNGTCITSVTDPVRVRARKNWQKAYKLVIKDMLVSAIGVRRKFTTYAQMFTELHGDDYTEIDACESPMEGKKRRLDNRTPILLMLGGGMAAGKSTVREIIGSDERWSAVSDQAVVIEADAIKNEDLVYKELKSRFGEDPAVSRLVHEFSTSNAEAMLVSAVNRQKDIIFDGTMTWLPFVEQTIKMVRDNSHNYKKGPGYYHDEAGNSHELYWEHCPNSNIQPGDKIPYRIELIGVTCDPGLAVARGIWRKIKTGRGVEISSQLRSHRLFSQNFEAMSKLVDRATLYHTGSNLTTFSHCSADIKPPEIICKGGLDFNDTLSVEDPEAWREFQKIKELDDSAQSAATLYDHHDTSDASHSPLARTITSKIHDSNIFSLRDSLQRAHRNNSLPEEL